MFNAFLNGIGWAVVLTVAVVMTVIEMVIKAISAVISIACVIVVCFIAPLFRIKSLPNWLSAYVEYSLKIQRWDITWTVAGYYREWLSL